MSFLGQGELGRLKQSVCLCYWRLARQLQLSLQGFIDAVGAESGSANYLFNCHYFLSYAI
ncbi:hypothetical protein [Candidatus Enterococcus clewellii]|uniref:hypothetical protein n=1 Tax=Candidatus Enterococcus clewellii TaxID=1834193 RepID=UPI0014835D48|nr:hypothetical protein [Enterococcus sp. 9E7_DIV0242]